ESVRKYTDSQCLVPSRDAPGLAIRRASREAASCPSASPGARMINPYRSLSANLPERLPAGRDALPADAKRLHAWVDALPRANQQAYLLQLSGALDAFHARQLEGFTRLEVMEVLRTPLL